MLCGMMIAPIMATACRICSGPHPSQYGTNIPRSKDGWSGLTIMYWKNRQNYMTVESFKIVDWKRIAGWDSQLQCVYWKNQTKIYIVLCQSFKILDSQVLKESQYTCKLCMIPNTDIHKNMEKLDLTHNNVLEKQLKLYCRIV